MVYERVLFAGDFHCPFQDEACLSAMLQFCKWWKPNEIFLIGDLIDFYAISHFLKDPERALKLQDEIDSAVNVLEQIRKANPTAKICFVRGNHEARLQKYLWSNAKELSSLRDLTVESLLHLKHLDITYEPKGRLQHKGIIIKHGSLVRKFSAYTAKGEFEKERRSGVSGHTHRQGQYRETNAGVESVWQECGCMCLRNPEYMEGEPANWHVGWAIGYFKKNSDRYNLDYVPFISGKAMYAGKEFI